MSSLLSLATRIFSSGADGGMRAQAAMSGNLEISKWCRSNGCPWNSRRCEEEAVAHTLSRFYNVCTDMSKSDKEAHRVRGFELLR